MKRSIVLSILMMASLSLVACNQIKNEAETVGSVDSKPEVSQAGQELKVEKSKSEDFVPEKDSYQLVVEKSTLKWGATKIVGNGHTGSVPLLEGSLEVKEGQFVGGDFVVDMKNMTADDGGDGLINHLKGEDFFDVEKYPTSTFKLASIESLGEMKYKVMGDLSILEQTHPIEFMAQMEKSGSGAMVNAQFDIDRLKWGIIYGSGKLGDKIINDQINYDISLYFE